MDDQDVLYFPDNSNYMYMWTYYYTIMPPLNWIILKLITDIWHIIQINIIKFLKRIIIIKKINKTN
jgi:hypothetical protein